jgi:hypothetical protein
LTALNILPQVRSETNQTISGAIDAENYDFWIPILIICKNFEVIGQLVAQEQSELRSRNEGGRSGTGGFLRPGIREFLNKHAANGFGLSEKLPELEDQVCYVR